MQCNAAQPLHLILLTHPTEFSKLSNTGNLVAPALADEAGFKVHRLVWSRVAPDQHLLQMAATGQLMLLYPTSDALLLLADVEQNTQRALQPNPILDLPSLRGIVLLDATWQLAHKMFRQSPYLQSMPALALQCNQPSQYLLRRNQRQQGWCTAESVALLLTALGHSPAAAKVSTAFHQFNQRN